MEASFDRGQPESPPSEIQEIVCDILRHRLEQESLEWSSCPVPASRPTSKICLSLRSLVDEFRSRYEDHFQQMFDASQFEHDPAAVEAAFLAIVSELFQEGIKWEYIVAFFVLSGEFAVIFSNRNWPDMLHHLTRWLVSYIDSHLYIWIQEHGGWESMIHHYGDDTEPESSKWPRLKNWVCGVTVGAIGVLTLKAILAQRS